MENELKALNRYLLPFPLPYSCTQEDNSTIPRLNIWSMPNPGDRKGCVDALVLDQVDYGLGLVPMHLDIP
jgi:hypothetical protein